MFYQTDDFLQGFIDVMKLCNSKILEIYHSPSTKVYYKNDQSPLTLADQTANKIICDYLQELNSSTGLNIGIISEENKNESYQIRSQYKYVWLVDPLDGTKEFVKKNGQFTVNIGLCHQGIPVFGIVSIPVTGEIYYGILGIGSFKLPHQKLQVLPKNLEKSGLKIVTSASHLNSDTREYLQQFSKPEIVHTGSSIKLLWIAEGKADLYPRLAPTSEWDTCAAHAVVKYAGGTVLQYNTNIELKYNKENLLNPYFIVY